MSGGVTRKSHAAVPAIATRVTHSTIHIVLTQQFFLIMCVRSWCIVCSVCVYVVRGGGGTREGITRGPDSDPGG